MAPSVLVVDGELAAAVARAPSVHNTQPWRLWRTDGGYQLRTAQGRWLPATDPDAREMRMSCGAALLNLRLATAVSGARPATRLMPEADFPGLLATVMRGEHRPPTAEERALHAMIPVRRSDRRPFQDRPVPEAWRHLLRRAAATEEAWLHAVDDAGERASIAALLKRAHEHQQADPAFLHEWAGWTGRADGATFGVPTASGGVAPAENDVWMVRDFTHAPPGDAGVAPTVADAPLLLLIGTTDDRPVAHLRAGQALQRVLLTATALGLATSIVSAVVEVGAARRALARVAGRGMHPQILVRVGFADPDAPPPPATPRAPVSWL